MIVLGFTVHISVKNQFIQIISSSNHLAPCWSTHSSLLLVPGSGHFSVEATVARAAMKCD